jgi:hypothetical protein
MNHETPEVVRVGAATVVIEGQQLKQWRCDRELRTPVSDGPAYEADE